MPTNPINPSDYLPDSPKIEHRDAEFSARTRLKQTDRTRDDTLRSETRKSAETKENFQKETKIQNRRIEQVRQIRKLQRQENEVEQTENKEIKSGNERGNMLDITG
ncbi:MAG: hypothetical protein ABIA63_01840 [bacterium]